MISNYAVHNLENAIRISKFPMVTNLSKINGEAVDRTFKLANTERGEGHDNFLHGILVTFDLAFTNKAWVEFERYHFADIISSQSTMHRIANFDLDKSYIKYVDKRIIGIMNDLKNRYNETKDPEDYLKLLYSNPCGFTLTAGIATNYGQLKTMYHQRKNHRLPEWKKFCAWCESLPMFVEFCCKGVYIFIDIHGEVINREYDWTSL